jgi:hypothetical protein
MTINSHPHKTPSQIACDLSNQFKLTVSQQETVRLMAASAIVARQGIAGSIRKILCSGDANDPEQLRMALDRLVVSLDAHPEMQLGD